MKLLRIFKGYRELESKNIGFKEQIELLKESEQIIKIEGNKKKVEIEGLDKLTRSLYLEGNYLSIRNNTMNLGAFYLVNSEKAIFSNNLFHLSDIKTLFNNWKKIEFGKSPHGFDLEKIEGARLFADFLGD